MKQIHAKQRHLSPPGGRVGPLELHPQVALGSLGIHVPQDCFLCVFFFMTREMRKKKKKKLFGQACEEEEDSFFFIFFALFSKNEEEMPLSALN